MGGVRPRRLPPRRRADERAGRARRALEDHSRGPAVARRPRGPLLLLPLARDGVAELRRRGLDRGLLRLARRAGSGRVSYVTMDDRFPENPKVAALSAPAFRLFVTAVCYSNRNL